MFFGLVQIISRLTSQNNFRPPYWRIKDVLQHGASILSSIIFRGTFRRISQLWDNTQTLNLESCLLYLSSIISQFPEFIHCIVFRFTLCCATMHALYCSCPKWQIHRKCLFFHCVDAKKTIFRKNKQFIHFVFWPCNVTIKVNLLLLFYAVQRNSLLLSVSVLNKSHRQRLLKEHATTSFLCFATDTRNFRKFIN